MLKRKLKYFKVLIIIFILTISFLGAIPFVFAETDTFTVSASSDDVLVKRGASLQFDLTHVQQPAGDYSSVHYDYEGGMRWTVDIPQGVTIQSAYLKIVAVSLLGSIPTMIIEGEDVDDAVTFSDFTDYDGRIRTVQSVNWTPEVWVTGVTYSSLDISSIIQVIVNRGGFGTHIVLFMSHVIGWGEVSETIIGASYDHLTYNPPKLEVTWGIADNEPFYSDVGSDDVTQVGENVDFWVFWEDDFALDECYFSTNNTGIWANTNISVSGVSSWANITLQLNFTVNMRVEWKWFCSDNASQWNNTSTYFLITTSLYITWNHNNSTMGNFYVNDILMANETETAHDFGVSINLVGGAFTNFSFFNFTWFNNNSVINNYNYTTDGNNTVWCYFGIAEIGGIHEDYFVLGFVIAGCAILFMVIVLKGNKKEK